MTFILCVTCFIVAVAIGAWRQMCGAYELQMPFNCPRIWHHTWIKVVTWLLSTSLSIIFAFILSTWIVTEVNEWFGKFTFGVFLYLRWLVSAFIGGYPAIKRSEEFALNNAKDYVDYDTLADNWIKARRKSGQPEIDKHEVIAMLKKSAHDVSSNNLTELEKRALVDMRNIQK